MTLTLKEAEERLALLTEAFELAGMISQAKAPAPVTAAGAPRGVTGTHIERMAAGSRATRSPELHGNGGGSAVTITAALAARGIVPGAPLRNSTELGELMAETLRQLGPDGSTGRRQKLVAKATWDLPPERQLGLDTEINTAKLNAVCGITAPRVSKHDGSLTASGGVCLPLSIDYSVPTWSTADRPLRDNLPAFQATRGGVSFVTPPDVGVPSLQGTASGAGTSVTVWTEATDANPAGALKPVWQVACGTVQTVYVDAIPTRVEFGNMQSRFAPEQIASNTEQAIAISAREAELNLLTHMYNASNQILASKYLGATRDLLASVDLVREGYLHSHRIPRTAAMTAVFPAWAMGVIRSDMARELAHDNAGSQNSLAISDSQIADWFDTRGINVIWTLDGLKAGTYGNGGSAIPNQFFPLATPGAEPQWPGQTSDGAFVLSWLLFVEGSFQFLDGGRLDLGVVRDSVLDATNDYETFIETFESVAFRGVEVYQVQSTILPNGASAATSTATYHE